MKVVKVICFLKRNPRLSFEEFVKYYESTHRLLGLAHTPGSTRYSRRYLQPQANSPVPGFTPTADFDVITELWFDNEADYEKTLAHLRRPEVAKIIQEDEERLFDRPNNRFFLQVDERVDLPEMLRFSNRRA
jgi:hypothetical protein